MKGTAVHADHLFLCGLGQESLQVIIVGLGITPGYPPGDVEVRIWIHLAGLPSGVLCKQIRAAQFDSTHDALHDFYIRLW